MLQKILVRKDYVKFLKLYNEEIDTEEEFTEELCCFSYVPVT